MTKGTVSNNTNSTASSGAANSYGHHNSARGGNKGPRKEGTSRRQPKSWKPQMFSSSGNVTTSTPIEVAPEKGIMGLGSSSYEGGTCSSDSPTGNGVDVICSYCMNSHPAYQQCYCEMDSGLYSTFVDSLSPGYYANYSQQSGMAFYYPNMTMPPQQSPTTAGGVYLLTGPEYDGSSSSPCYSDFETQQGILVHYGMGYMIGWDI